MKPKRVCFLYIAQIHQVLHSLTTATALAADWPELEVEVAAVTEGHLDYIDAVLARLGAARLKRRLLGPGWLRSARARRSAVPPKMPMLVANLPLLGGYDAIVTPERTTAVIRKFGLKHPQLVYTQHGAGDRAGPFEPRLGVFDLVFATGAKQRDRMVGEGLVQADSCVVVGYPKFDLVDALAEPPPRLFEDDRPVVIYNPHFDPGVSSWPRWGLQVLRAFVDDQRYNLIFAPHIRLFEGASRLELEALAPFRDRRNIHIDLGGPASVDMTYTRMADVYLGDVSSQVYEFLRRPRPCVHLNAHAVDWRGDESYRHWRFGPVLETPAGLVDAVDQARTLHGAYAAIQEEGFRFSFDLQSRSSSRRSAEAIADLLQTSERRP